MSKSSRMPFTRAVACSVPAPPGRSSERSASLMSTLAWPSAATLCSTPPRVKPHHLSPTYGNASFLPQAHKHGPKRIDGGNGSNARAIPWSRPAGIDRTSPRGAGGRSPSPPPGCRVANPRDPRYETLKVLQFAFARGHVNRGAKRVENLHQPFGVTLTVVVSEKRHEVLPDL